MRPYGDTNFFTRVYLALPESEEADALLGRARDGRAPPLPVTWLLRVELLNAFQLHVFAGRNPRQIRVTAEQAAAAQAHFQGDLARPTFLQPAGLELSALERQSEELALRHTARHGFRAYDLLHVSTALALGCDTFWSFDPKASKLATLEGLTIR